jgi:hypothetical protein
MSEATPRWGYGESCPIWRKMVTERSGDCTQRRKQARLTNASDASSWRNFPTPTALEEKYRIGGNTQASKNLTAMARRGELNSNWPTPRAGNPGSRKPGTGGKILAEEAKKNWGTPASNDANKTPHCEINSKQGGLSKSVGIEEAKIHNGPPAPEKSSTSGKNHGSPKLNPNWVEQLMGLPVGWTQLPTEWTDSASSEMALSPKPQK